MKHTIEPVFDKNSAILILGSFPSVRSREVGFYYGHPQNRFWKLISALTGSKYPVTVPEKKALLLSHGIALWDVIASCNITGSSDTSIKNVIPNDIGGVILSKCSIRHIYLNGGTAGRLFERVFPGSDIPNTVLPSTSPANASFSLKMLIDAWSVITEHMPCNSVNKM